MSIYSFFCFFAGHLLERLNNRNGSPLPEGGVYRIFGQLVNALQPFHNSRPVLVHRDLKLENILLDPVRLYATTSRKISHF